MTPNRSIEGTALLKVNDGLSRWAETFSASLECWCTHIVAKTLERSPYVDLTQRKSETMKTLITEFISLDGVVQAPGGASEDTDGGFSHGGWSMKYFDPVVMGGMYTERATTR